MLQYVVGGLAVLGAGVGLLIHGDVVVGTALVIAGAGELGAKVVAGNPSTGA